MLKTLGIVKGALLTDRQSRQLERCLEGKSVLEWVVRQMTDCELLTGVVVLADEGSSGDVVRKLAPADVPVFSCTAADSISLLQRTLERFSTESFVFMGADWPFLDPTLVDQLVHAAEQDPRCDYAAYQFTNEMFSPGRPYGLFPEWYRSDAVRGISDQITDPIHRQLPGTFFLDHQRQYTVELLPVPAALDQQANIRYAFDDEADWDVILDLHDAIGIGDIDCRQIGRLLGSPVKDMVY